MLKIQEAGKGQEQAAAKQWAADNKAVVDAWFSGSAGWTARSRRPRSAEHAAPRASAADLRCRARGAEHGQGPGRPASPARRPRRSSSAAGSWGAARPSSGVDRQVAQRRGAADEHLVPGDLAGRMPPLCRMSTVPERISCLVGAAHALPAR